MPGHPRHGEQVKITMCINLKAGKRYKISYLDDPHEAHQISANCLSKDPPLSTDPHVAKSSTQSIFISMSSLIRLCLFLKERFTEQSHSISTSSSEPSQSKVHHGSTHQQTHMENNAIGNQEQTHLETTDSHCLEEKGG